MALTDLIPFAEQVRDETQAGANTAIRVGQLFVDIITQAAQQDQTLAQALAALPALPFDSARFYTTDNQGQDQWTGDQAIEFLCNGVVVATLPIKVAAQAYSGLLSAADKTKIDAMPADTASEGDAIGSLIASATPTSTDITPYAVDGTIKTPISVPAVSKDILQGGAINAGVVTAALCNAADLYGQGLEVKVKSGQTLTLLIGGTRLYKGGVLQLTELDGIECQGFLSMSIDGLNVPIFNDASVEFFTGGTTFSLDLGNAMEGAGYAGEFGIVTAATLRAVVGRDYHVRLRVVDSMQTSISTLTYGQSANGVQIYGKDSRGQTITFVNLPAASTSKAGVMSSADKIKLNSIETGAQTNVQADWGEEDDTSDAYIFNKPTIGTSAALNVPAVGNASSSEVVKGNDTRLTNARPASDVYPWAKAENPPAVTKADVGLGNVDNTSDLNKPISTATQTALDGKQNVLPIETTSASASLDCAADKYYVLTATIGTLAITLPTMTDAAKVHTIGIYLTTGATPAITISGTNTIKYDDTWAIDANATHEINALWNGTAWVLTLIHAA